jgi:translation elongation factor EF-1alpha
MSKSEFSRFKAKIFNHSLKRSVIPGMRYRFLIGDFLQSGIVEELLFELDKGTEVVLKESPRFITNNSTAVVLISLDERSPMENTDNFDCYSKLQIIDEFSSVAYGRILELIE